MERLLMAELVKWKGKKIRKPLLIRGARQGREDMDYERIRQEIF